MFNTGFTKYFNTKQQTIKKLPANTIILSPNTQIKINTIDGVRWINVGDAGSGKSWKNGIECSQFKNVVFWDPTKKFYQNIIKQANEIKQLYGDEEAQKYRQAWKLYQLTPEEILTKNYYDTDEGKIEIKPFKMNVNDLNSRCLDAIFWRVEKNQKEIIRRQLLHEFLMRKHKTYKDWKQLCEEVKGLDAIFNDLEWILSHDDSAPSLESIVHGKSIVDISDISTNNCCVGAFMQSLFGLRKDLSDDYLFDPNHFVIMALDEAQDYCINNNPFGVAFADINKQARKFGIGEILTGSAYNKLHIDVRTKSNMQFVFKSKGMTNKYRNNNLDIMPEEWDNLQEHACFVFDDTGKYSGPSGGDSCYPYFYYIEEKLRNNINTNTIKEQSSFNPTNQRYFKSLTTRFLNKNNK